MGSVDKGGEMKQKKDLLTIHKEANKGKYNKVTRTVPPRDMSKIYDMSSDGWRRKQ